MCVYFSNTLEDGDWFVHEENWNCTEITLISVVRFKRVCIPKFGFTLTIIFFFIPQAYTLRRGLSGKDLGKKGTLKENDDM